MTFIYQVFNFVNAYAVHIIIILILKNNYNIAFINFSLEISEKRLLLFINFTFSTLNTIINLTPNFALRILQQPDQNRFVEICTQLV